SDVARPRIFRSPFSSNEAFSVSLLPGVLATRTISLSKFTSGTLSATFHALTSFSKSLALVMTPFSGISLASFSSSTEPIQELVALSGIGAAPATPAARHSRAARETDLHNDMARLLEPSCYSQRNKPKESMQAVECGSVRVATLPQPSPHGACTTTTTAKSTA